MFLSQVGVEISVYQNDLNIQIPLSRFDPGYLPRAQQRHPQVLRRYLCIRQGHYPLRRCIGFVVVYQLPILSSLHFHHDTLHAHCPTCEIKRLRTSYIGDEFSSDHGTKGILVPTRRL